MASTAPVGKLTAASSPNPKMNSPSIVKPTENDQMLIGPGFSNRGPMRFAGSRSAEMRAAKNGAINATTVNTTKTLRGP